ncbi:MAG: phage holin family protein [Nocardioides sp.]
MRTVIWLGINALAIAVAAWVLDGIWFAGPTSGQAELAEKAVPVLLVSVILGLVTVFVEPVVKFLSFPFIVVTIGLFLLVINALMLLLTAWIAGKLEIGFTVNGFWAALLGSIIITIVTGFLELAVPEDD